MFSIDLNCDAGESYGAWTMGDDASLLATVSSANVACGFHAGDPSGLLTTLRLAARHGVAVGAHVSYPDRVGFGRRAMDVASADLTADVVYQLGALQGLARMAGTAVRYVKPHGALYNTMAHDERQATAVVAALLACDPTLPLVVLAGAPACEWASAAGLTVVPEVFADRAYTAAGTLVSRRAPGAVLHDPDEVARRIGQWVREGTLPTVDGGVTHLQARTVCVHGDTPDAARMARTLREALIAQDIAIRPFA